MRHTLDSLRSDSKPLIAQAHGQQRRAPLCGKQGHLWMAASLCMSMLALQPAVGHAQAAEVPGAAASVPRLAEHRLAGDMDETLRTLIIRDDAAGILRHGAKLTPLNGQDAKGQGPLHLAIERESQNAFKALLQLPGLAFDAPNRLGETPLMLAAIKGDRLAVDWLLRMGAALQREGWTPLHYAACTDRLDILEMLLAKGAPVNAPSANGTTPLMMAASYGTEAVVLRLLDAGADRRLTNQRGMTAADAAEQAGRDSLVRRLRQP